MGTVARFDAVREFRFRRGVLMTGKQIDLFATDLKELLVRHRVTIGGCGCCGSPWIAPVEGGEKILGVYAQTLSFNSKPPFDEYQMAQELTVITWKPGNRCS